MKNRFVVTEDGRITHFDTWQHDFTSCAMDAEAANGGSVILSATISIDALLSIREIINQELTARAESQIENQ